MKLFFKKMYNFIENKEIYEESKSSKVKLIGLKNKTKKLIEKEEK